MRTLLPRPTSSRTVALVVTVAFLAAACGSTSDPDAARTERSRSAADLTAGIAATPATGPASPSGEEPVPRSPGEAVSAVTDVVAPRRGDTPQPKQPTTTTTRPAIPAPPGRIVFATDYAYAPSHVVAVDPDGTDDLDLGQGWDPVWSPDGTQIAMVRDAGDAGAQLVVSTPDGSRQRVVTTWVRREGLSDISWSPDGKRLAFVTSVPPGSYTVGPAAQKQIRVVGVDGTGERVVVAAPSDSTFPEWSPDGELIAFTTLTTGGGRLSVVRPDGTGLRTVVHHHDAARAPSWSPDGRLIAFVAFETGPDLDGSNLWVVGRDGTGLRKLAPAFPDHGETGPEWSPDGTRIAYEYLGIETIRPDGSGHLRLSPDGQCDIDAQQWVCDHNPAWSPDGRTLAFVSQGHGGDTRLHLVDADGSNRRTVGYHLGATPRWQPA